MRIWVLLTTAGLLVIAGAAATWAMTDPIGFSRFLGRSQVHEDPPECSAPVMAFLAEEDGGARFGFGRVDRAFPLSDLSYGLSARDEPTLEGSFLAARNATTGVRLVQNSSEVLEHGAVLVAPLGYWHLTVTAANEGFVGGTVFCA